MNILATQSDKAWPLILEDVKHKCDSRDSTFNLNSCISNAWTIKNGLNPGDELRTEQVTLFVAAGVRFAMPLKGTASSCLLSQGERALLQTVLKTKIKFVPRHVEEEKDAEDAKNATMNSKLLKRSERSEEEKASQKAAKASATTKATEQTTATTRTTATTTTTTATITTATTVTCNHWRWTKVGIGVG